MSLEERIKAKMNRLAMAKKYLGEDSQIVKELSWDREVPAEVLTLLDALVERHCDCGRPLYVCTVCDRDPDYRD